MKYFSITSQGNKLRGFVMKPEGKAPYKTVIVSHVCQKRVLCIHL